MEVAREAYYDRKQKSVGWIQAQKDFIDSEVIKEKLETLNVKLDLIITHLEALQSSIGVYSVRLGKELKP